MLVWKKRSSIVTVKHMLNFTRIRRAWRKRYHETWLAEVRKVIHFMTPAQGSSSKLAGITDLSTALKAGIHKACTVATWLMCHFYFEDGKPKPALTITLSII